MRPVWEDEIYRRSEYNCQKTLQDKEDLPSCKTSVRERDCVGEQAAEAARLLESCVNPVLDSIGSGSGRTDELAT